MPDPTFAQLDQVELLSARRVSYLSARPGTTTSPQGVWSVVGIIDDQLLLAKHGVLIKLPILDVRKVAVHSVDQVLTALRGYLDVRQRRQVEAEEAYQLGQRGSAISGVK